jgi:short subunit dehydrogenase-like uncharacterized protein
LLWLAVRGGVSGGTIESMVNSFQQDSKLVKETRHPYYLVPELAAKPVQALPDRGVSMGVSRSQAANGWYGPSLPAMCNELVVRRSNALLGYGALHDVAL